MSREAASEVGRHDKPEGERLGWHLLETTYPFATHWLKLRQDRIRIEGANSEITFTYIDNGPAVIVVPVTAEGNIALIRQYRYTVDEWCVEVPAGGTHDAEGASMEEVARKELREEIGATCAGLEFVSLFYPTNGNSAQAFHVFLALDTRLDGEQCLEETESIQVHLMPVAEALRLARTGQIKDGASALSLLLCEPLLRERGYL